VEQPGISPDQPSPVPSADLAGAEEGPSARKRRRRRGGRRRRPTGVDGLEQQTASAEGTPESVEARGTGGVDGQTGNEESASEEE
jgi:hypothetical protein